MTSTEPGLRSRRPRLRRRVDGAIAHEALIHRIDAELTAELPVGPIPADLAADGVDEKLRWMFRMWAPIGVTTDTGPVGRLIATDVDRSWIFTLGRFTGTSPDLDPWLWNRSARSEPALTGDRSGYQQFRDVLVAGVH